MRDLFDRIHENKGPLGKWASQAEGYFVFPKLEGPISNRMKFKGKEVITWSVNDYLGLANLPEIRKVDAEAAAEFGSAYPMGARMMSGHTDLHEQLENELAEFVDKESAYLLNFGYQGILSTVDTLVGKDDVIVYDVDAHACIVDGVRSAYRETLYLQAQRCSQLRKRTYSALPKSQNKQVEGFSLFQKGVFGMRGEQGRLREIAALKSKYTTSVFSRGRCPRFWNLR